MKKKLLENLTKGQIRKLCSTKVYSRGIDYYYGDAVRNLIIKGEDLYATVEGSYANSYRVAIKDDGKTITASCTCPYDMGGFCKHIVAVLLAWIDKREGKFDLRGEKEKIPVADMYDIGEFLRTKSKEELVEMLLNHATYDDGLMESFLLEASLRTGKSVNVKDYKSQIRYALREGFIDWAHSWDFLQNLEKVKEKVDELIYKKFYGEAKEILEYFLEKAIGKIEEIDDSSGNFASFVQSLYESYAKAVRSCNVNPEIVGRWTFRTIMEDDYCLTDELLVQMKDALGKRGFAIIERLAWDELNKRPAPPMEKRHQLSYDIGRSRLKRILLEIAELQKDDEKYIKVCEPFLNDSPYSYIELAKKLVSLKRNDEAIRRLEEGLYVFPSKDTRLNDLLSVLYEKKGELEKAFEHAWISFEYGFSHYRRVKSLALKLNIWNKVHNDVITHLKKRAPSELLIDFYVEDKSLNKAIEEIKLKPYSEHVVLNIAKLAEDKYPEDALLFYQYLAENQIERKNNECYREAKRLLGKAKIIYKRLKKFSDWEKYISKIKTTHKAKRNLMKELTELRF